MKRANFQPDEYQEPLFDLEPPTVVDDVDIQALVSDQNVPLNELIHHVARNRLRNAKARQLAAGVVKEEVDAPLPGAGETATASAKPKQAKSERKPGRFIGGAFTSGIQRRIKKSNGQELLALTSDQDIALLAPKTSLKKQLYPINKPLVFDGVLLTPAEYIRITLSPTALSGRVDARVQNKEDGRTPTEANQRSHELRLKAAVTRSEAIDINISNAHEDTALATRLGNEMSMHGLAHMTREQMDELIEAMEARYVGMLKAITKNHKLATERVESLEAALTYLLTNEDADAAVQYWKDINWVYRDWTKNKLIKYDVIKARIQKEIQAIEDEVIDNQPA